MPKVDPIQTSFAGGEFGPSLYGRTDVAQYANACEIVENFLVRPFGSLISTPGTKYIGNTKDTYAGTACTSAARLIQFIFSQTDAYIIEMGNLNFRFYTDSAVVVSTGTTPYDVAHSYSSAQLFDVQYAQKNDVIYFAHKSHPPMKLTRKAASNWTMEQFDFLGGPFLEDNATAITLQASGSTGTITITLSATNSTTYFVPSSSATNLGSIGSYWKIGGLVTVGTLALQGYVEITGYSQSTIAVATVKSQLSTVAATTDWAEGAWSWVRGFPACVTFHESRLFFARTDHEPDKVWGSQPFVYDNFMPGAEDDDGLSLGLASNESNEIKWMTTTGKALAVGTFGGEFVISGADVGGPLTPSSVTAGRQTSWGSEAIIPRKVGNYVYYVQRFGRKLRELFYTWDLDTYKSVDKTILSSHILGDGVKDIAYQQNPETMLWCVLTGGTIAVLTREVDQEVQGWSRQVTDGEYESIATIPSQDGPFDEIWVVVKRTIGGVAQRYIEQFQNIEVPDRQDQCFYLHSGLTYDAYAATSTPTAVSISISNIDVTSAIVTSSDVYFAANDIGQRIRAIDADGNTLGELEVTSYASTTIVYGTIVYTFSTTAYAAGYWGVSVNVVTGMDHLEAETVRVLGDGGMDEPDKVVGANGTAGSVVLAYDYFVVTCGLPYTSTMKTLPYEAGAARGTAQGKIQRISTLGIKVNRSYKGFKVGGTTALAERVDFRDPSTVMGSPETLYTGIMSNITFRSDYQVGSQIVIINEDPLPVEILSLMPQMETFE